MKKKITTMPREQFCTRFLRKLQSFRRGDPIVALILKAPSRRELCANLLWNCEMAGPRLDAISSRRRDFWADQYEKAITGAEALALIARENDNPEFAQLMLRAREAVLVLQSRLPAAFPPAQERGRSGRDWGAVLYAQRMLEGHLGGEDVQMPPSQPCWTLLQKFGQEDRYQECSAAGPCPLPKTAAPSRRHAYEVLSSRGEIPRTTSAHTTRPKITRVVGTAERSACRRVF